MKVKHIFKAQDYQRRNPALPQASVTVTVLPPLPSKVSSRWIKEVRLADAHWRAPRNFAVFSEHN